MKSLYNNIINNTVTVILQTDKGTEQNAKEWMDHLGLKGNECGYKERDRRLKEQFIESVEEVMTEMIRQLSSITGTNKVTNK